MAPEINDATERVLEANSRKVKFRDSEANDETMVAHHDRVGQESSPWNLNHR